MRERTENMSDFAHSYTFVQSQITVIMTTDFFCYDSCCGNKCTEKNFPLFLCLLNFAKLCRMDICFCLQADTISYAL